MRSSTRYGIYLLWIFAVFILGIYVFTSGFLLQRRVLPNETTCQERGCNQPPTVFKKAIVILIDALKYEFCAWNSTWSRSSASREPGDKLNHPSHHINQLPVLHRLSRPSPDTGQIHGKIFRFMADPPTTTMQRLKGLTTGSLPTFIDASSNFASYQIQEDSWLNQLTRHNKSIHFAGDDTWLSLYPDTFKKSVPLPSFDVWDLDTVDTQVTKFLYSELGMDWDILLGHYLGVDHAGHKFGPNHPEMRRKLREMNAVIEHVVDNLPEDTVLVVLGDHGMTNSGDHGGDSLPEIEAGLFVYGLKLGFDLKAEASTVSQIDLVPTLSLLLGVPVPFSNLGALIDELLIPTMLIKESGSGSHSRLTSFSQEDLIKFRMSYMKANVHQVYKYLTAYLNAGGSFPEKENYRIRNLASEVINRPGALSPTEARELYIKCKEFLQAAKHMCQAVWVNFNEQAITIGLTIVVLHLSILSILVCKPQSRLISTLISGFLLICIGASILLGSFFGVTLAVLADWINAMDESLPTMDLLLIYSLSFFTLLTNGMWLLWKVRYCMKEMVLELKSGHNIQYVCSAGIYLLISFSVFSNSFVVNESSVLGFCFVSTLFLYLILHTRKSVPVSLLILGSVGLTRLSFLYVRCREEDGPDCVLTQYHKPLSTLDNESGFYRNWRYFFTLLSLFLLCLSVHLGLSSAGNLNGISCSVLTAKYLPWIIAVLMASYWALQSFPSPLISKLLPWQHNLIVHTVLLLVLAGIFILVLNPRLVYFQTKKKNSSRIYRQENIPCYFNYMKANWRTTLSDKSTPSIPLGYGLGSCLSAPFISISVFFVFLSMLISGDGQCPAVLAQFLLMLGVIVITSQYRLYQMRSLSGLLDVSLPVLLPWILLDNLSFFTSGLYYTILNINRHTLDTTRQSFILYFRFILILSLISILLPFILQDNFSFFNFRFILILSLISMLQTWILLDNLSFFYSGSY
ncbi:GPI ethanolamine phosphate transferase 3 [Eurytemora carolleeae]|uniref:GPI ethanolamine phosphate transferase 3 n=1 Tax=Eurytemora carolleeae TaxID=1294199 RepID=UPI000C77AF4C|nr:GPI ethanolamine phosphate transferase 3 [Eurytemora carolleeae]|eukprot:XP_023334554.1 GPI ethanolamine phosphate transferase 3-like [Eurytemora affinis]